MSNQFKFAGAAIAYATTAGCAHIDFESSSGLLYFDPAPYLFVAPNADCTLTATLVMLPGPTKHLRFVDGYGSVELSVGINNGMITSVGQKVDNKVSDTLTSLAALQTAFTAARAVSAPVAACTQKAMLYEVKDGKVGAAVPFPRP